METEESSIREVAIEMFQTEPVNPAQSQGDEHEAEALGRGAQVPSGNGSERRLTGFPETVQPIEDASAHKRGQATGPKTERGKAISSKNALKFGFFSKEVAIETPFYKGWKPKYKRILKALSEDWKPVGATEVLLLELAAVQVIQYDRLLQVQQALILKESTPQIPQLDYLFPVEEAQLCAEKTGAARIDPEYAEELRRDKIVGDRVQQKYKKEFERQEQLEKEHERIDGQRRALPTPENLEWLRTSENHILRHLYRALSELERLQRVRLGDKVPPRLVLEVRKD